MNQLEFFSRNSNYHAGIGDNVRTTLEFYRLLERHRPARAELDGLLKVLARRALGFALVAPLWGCGPDSGGVVDAGSQTSDVDGLTGSSSVAATSDSASATGLSTDDAPKTGDEAGPVDACTPSDPSLHETTAFVQAPGWPEGGPITASCDGVSLTPAEGFFELLDLQLSCMDLDSDFVGDVHIYFAEEAIAGELQELPSAQDLQVSFYWPEPDVSAHGALLAQLTIRDGDGDLILWAHSDYWFGVYLAEDDVIPVGGPIWLEPGTMEYEEWNPPFGEMVVRNVGCNPRESIRPGATMETPLALQLMSDEGPVEIYDRNVEWGVSVGGQLFDVVVSDAFFRNDFNCGDCPAMEIGILIWRSVR